MRSGILVSTHNKASDRPFLPDSIHTLPSVIIFFPLLKRHVAKQYMPASFEVFLSNKLQTRGPNQLFW
jgi:hypothetical protein